MLESCKVESTYSVQEFPENGKINEDWVNTLINNMKNKIIESLIEINVEDDADFSIYSTETSLTEDHFGGSYSYIISMKNT